MGFHPVPGELLIVSARAILTSATPRETVLRGYTLQSIRRVLQGLLENICCIDQEFGILSKSRQGR